MSNIIKSFRVVDKTHLSNPLDKQESSMILDNRSQDKYQELIDQAKEEAASILEQARQDGDKLVAEAREKVKQLDEKSQIESKKLLEEAKENGYNIGNKKGHKDGFTKGHKEGKDQAQSIIDQALSLKEDNLITREEIANSLEPDILNMIITIYEKIIGDKSEDEDFILDLIKKGIADLDPTDDLTIIVSKDDYDKVVENKDLILAGASFINNLNIKYDINFNHRDCIFEMDKGNIDLGLDGQLEELKKTILKILDNE